MHLPPTPTRTHVHTSASTSTRGGWEYGIFGGWVGNGTRSIWVDGRLAVAAVEMRALRVSALREGAA
jgi:hypothetical protein